VETILHVSEFAVVSITVLDPEVWLPPETKATGECPIMNNFLSHDETVWVASRI
jgi:hypothetical protein